MKKLLLPIGILVFAILGCAQKETTQQLAKATPAYDLAKKLATTLDYLDPGKNAVLVSPKGFDIRAGRRLPNDSEKLRQSHRACQGLTSQILGEVLPMDAQPVSPRVI